jgi:hypothetical protein
MNRFEKKLNHVILNRNRTESNQPRIVPALTFDITHYSQRNFKVSYIDYVRSKPQVFSYCQTEYNNFFLTNVNYIAIDQRFLQQIFMFSCVGMTPNNTLLQFCFQT